MIDFKKIIVLLLFSLTSYAQLEQPAKWKFSVSNSKPQIGDVIELYFDAKIEKDWYLYSNEFKPDLGPIPITIEFQKPKGFSLVGKLTPINSKKKFDPVWDGEVTYFKEKARFVHKVKVLEKNILISGKLDFQTCTDVSGKCVNGNDKFEFKIEATEKPKDEAIANNEIPNIVDSSLVSSELTDKKSIVSENDISITKEESSPLESSGESQSLWKFLLIAFGAGVASIFMPCIYPIMPMTVSFFTKQKNGKSKALFYGISIMIIFGLMGLVTMAFGAPFLNFLSTHWVPNLIFFLIFILFGISLLGAFEIVLPHETVNRIDRMSDRGGLIGIFFMALTLVVVSFSCTVPFVGTLLIAASQGEVMRPIYGMLAFGLPFAMVFSGLAMFPSLLKNLPKSGGWLNELKAVFGFLEFALALKFLSNIDLAYNWHLIHRNIFLVVWIVIAIIIGIYILGFIRLEKDDKIEKRGAMRIGFAALFFLFAAYMLPGVTGKSLNILSGILPPMPIEKNIAEKPNDKMEQLINGLYGFKDYDDAVAYAKKVNKPILIDFTGHACANCRKMEENVWNKPEVFKSLQEDFVIASLYVDDKKDLPKEKHYVSTYDDELKTTVGERNMDLEITKYNNNAQPYYVIVNTKEERILEPVGYTSEANFLSFLKKGKAGF